MTTYLLSTSVSFQELIAAVSGNIILNAVSNSAVNSLRLALRKSAYRFEDLVIFDLALLGVVQGHHCLVLGVLLVTTEVAYRPPVTCRSRAQKRSNEVQALFTPTKNTPLE